MTDYRQSGSIPLVRHPQHRATSRSVQEDCETFQISSAIEANGVEESNDQKSLYYHLDWLGRPFKGQHRNDKTLNPYSGRLCDLVVQSSRDILDSESSARWFRTGLRNGSPWMIRISNWALSRDHGSEDRVGTEIQTAILRWIPACVALAIVSSLPIQVAPTPSNFGRYDAFHYRDWRYPLEARNKSENRPAKNAKIQEAQPHLKTQPTFENRERLNEPKYLCFLGDDDNIEWSKVSDWTEKKGKMTPRSYVFVSFTGMHFQSKEANECLRDVGKYAAKATGVSAYWISRSCLHDLSEKDDQKQKRENEDAIWSMSDVIRQASAVALAIPGPLDSQFNGKSLYEWGKRMWTMPELLLYTGKHEILIYETAKWPNPLQPRSIPRRELWSKVWSDSAYSGQLIDHYENSLTLSPLELVTVALQCLNKRETNVHLNGDMSYVLMGLLRQRPHIVRSDSAFQAFARLSLANDSNMLLERLICLLPKSLDEDWWSLDDAWNAMLWDIYPRTQICGIGMNDTVILDGARGAAIRWDKFIPVLTLGQESMHHRLIRWALRTIPAFFVAGIIWIIISSTFVKNGFDLSRGGQNRAYTPSVFLLLGILMVSFSSIVVFLSPYLTRLIYCATIHDSQPLFFGIEGYVDIYQLELLIFGSYDRRLRWGTASSPLSCHDLDRKGMQSKFFHDKHLKPEELNDLLEKENFYTGLDPVESGSAKDLVQKAKTGSELHKKIFTLVDTFTMTVTLFEAVRPPVAVILCGEEGGMQRALLCSEDWTSGTMYRETVVRMETRVRGKMDIMARIRLGLRRSDDRAAIEDPRDFTIRKAHWLKRLAYAVGARI